MNILSHDKLSVDNDRLSLVSCIVVACASSTSVYSVYSIRILVMAKSM